ncbi:MAG: alpha-glucan family phosphorylase [Candidatus Woesearchaeota archaeon]
MEKTERKIAYFTMEIGLQAQIPTYSGGLGILAGDTIKSMADLSVPTVCLTLLNKQGYFYQKITEDGTQIERPFEWNLHDFLTKTTEKVYVQIEDRTVAVGAYLFEVIGERGHKIPTVFLTTDLAENSDYDKTLTDTLYGGDRYYRFCQEVILGIGGVRMLEELGYTNIQKFHLNEGHAALATIELLHKHNMDIEVVKEKCIFTTHTPVAAGHDTFDIWMAGRILKDYFPWHTKFAEHDGKFNMTYLALNLSHYVNGVAKRHKEVSMQMFPGREIHSITNGIHSATWASNNMALVFSNHIPDWKHDPFSLRAVLSIPSQEIYGAHKLNKKNLIDFINNKYQADFHEDVFTIGFARRSTAYKRAELLFHDIHWLKAIAQRQGNIQLIFGGKAHVHDTQGKELIQKLVRLAPSLLPHVKLVYLENYDMELAKKLISGVDIWLNTPLRPLEASGTSGMKAALNGVPQFSILDGWWIEGCIEGKTGWSIGKDNFTEQDNSDEDAKDLYEKLEHKILPTYYHQKEDWISIMKHAIAMNASFFHTHRMVQQYVTNAYFR